MASAEPISTNKERGVRSNIDYIYIAPTKCPQKLVLQSTQSKHCHTSHNFPLHSAYREIRTLCTGYGISHFRPFWATFTSNNVELHDQTARKQQHDIQILGILGARYLSSPLYYHPRPITNKRPPGASFLDFCYLCKRPLDEGDDIFIYRGDRAFCSVECRCDHIVLDELPQVQSPSALRCINSTSSISRSRSRSQYNLAGSSDVCRKSYARLPCSTRDAFITN
eukprot:Gb_22548 [translate_table: standard]